MIVFQAFEDTLDFVCTVHAFRFNVFTASQAKGRIERLFAALQDRLIKEMGLAKVPDVESDCASREETAARDSCVRLPSGECAMFRRAS